MGREHFWLILPGVKVKLNDIKGRVGPQLGPGAVTGEATR